MTLSRRRVIVASSYATAGVLTLGALIAFDGRFPSFWRWLLFAVAFVVLEFNSVEVNDRLFQSSSVMVALTAGVVFALEGQSAALGMATIAAIGPFVAQDLRACIARHLERQRVLRLSEGRHPGTGLPLPR